MLRRVGAGAIAWLVSLAGPAPPVGGQPVLPSSRERPTQVGAATEAPGPPGVVLEVGYVAQSEALCGGAAVTMTLRYWGDDDVRPESFAPLLREDGTGIATEDLRRAVLERGWTALAFTGDVDMLSRELERGRPTVVLLEVGPSRFHYVTVVGHLARLIVFHDPAVSPYRTMAVDDFVSAWSGGGFWALLVLPDPDRLSELAGRRVVDRRVARAGQPPGDDARGAPVADEGPPGRGPCSTSIERAVELARTGALDAADRLLVLAMATCPEDARAPRELAALRLLEDRAAEAVLLALTAHELEPGDRHALEILAAARYLSGDDVAALDDWNRLEPVVVDEVTLASPTRTRNGPILGLTGLARGRVLTARSLELGRRRLGLLPAAAASRLSYRPRDDGRVVVAAAVAERPPYPSPAGLLVEGALGAFTHRGIQLESASPTRLGELWSLAWRWHEPRRRVRVGVSVPIRHPVRGSLALTGLVARETSDFGTEVREERRRADVELATWVAPWLRGSATLALDRWRDLGTFGSVGLAARAMGAGDRLGLTVAGDLWSTPGSATPFALARARLDWVSRLEHRGLVTSARVGGQMASGAAPRSIWPGAGSGSGRPLLARAHGLLTDGRITGPLFGRRIAYGGAETVWWMPAGPFDAGLASFLDLASVGARPAGIEGDGFQADLGVGVRLGLPRRGVLRADLARGLADGRTEVSAGLQLDLGPDSASP